MAANEVINPKDGQSADGGCNSSKRRYGFRLTKNNSKYPKEGLQNVISNYSASNNKKNAFVDNVKKLSHNIAVSGAIRYDAPTVAYAVKTFTAPVFEVA